MQHFGPNIVGPAASGKFPVVRCRGADSRARHSTNDLYQLPLKWKKLSTCHCEGALRPWQSREGTCSLYKLLLKRCAPIASVAALSERHAGQQHVAHGFCGVTPPELSLRGCFAPVAISQYLARLWESCRRNRNCLHEIATSASGLLAMTNLWPSLFYRQPVRIGSNAPGPAQHKRFVPATVKMEKAIDLSLRGRFAPVAISGRHLQSVQATVKTVCTNCVCSGAQ